MTGIKENAPGLWLNDFPWPEREDNKYSRGHAIIYGGAAKTGAARIAAMAALRAAAGLVTVVCPASVAEIYATHLVSVMVYPVQDAQGFASFLQAPHRDAILIGPGAGVDEQTYARVLNVLVNHKSCVLDADALTVFKDAPEKLFAAIKECGAPVILTPHKGEFDRIFGKQPWADESDPTVLASNAAKLSGAVVLLKGADTVIAAPDGRLVMNTNAPPTLATAGSGDVLAGIIISLLGNQMDGFDAACAAAWMHGKCGNEFGLGLIAEDLIAMLPKVLTKLKGSGN